MRKIHATKKSRSTLSSPLSINLFLLLPLPSTLCPCALHLASPLLLFLLSRRNSNIGCSIRLDEESLERKREIKKENAETPAARRRSFALVMHLVKPAQFGLSSCSGRVVGPAFDRLSAFSWSSTCAPRYRRRYQGGLDVPCAIVILAGTPRQENTSRLSRRLRGRARRAKENWRRESTFSQFAGVGQVGRFALDPPPISCSPLAPATVRQSTVDTCARSRLPIRISRQRQLTLHGAAKVQASILANSFWRSYQRTNRARAGPRDLSIRDYPAQN